MKNVSHENKFDLHENQHVGKTHFQMKGSLHVNSF